MGTYRILHNQFVEQQSFPYTFPIYFRTLIPRRYHYNSRIRLIPTLPEDPITHASDFSPHFNMDFGI